MKSNSKTLCGIILLIFGIVWILSIVGIFRFDLFFRGWWTLIIIAIGLVSFFGSGRDKTGSVIMMGVGVLLLLSMQNVITWDMFWKLGVAVFVIIAGVRLILGRRPDCWKDSARCEVKVDTEGRNIRSYSVSFGEERQSLSGEMFEGASVNVSFGAVSLDLRNAVISGDPVIEVECSFAGIELLVPPEVRVEVLATSTFGGVSDKRRMVYAEPAHTLYIKGNCNFAGIEIK